MLIFEYAIKFSDGSYYTGRVGEGMQGLKNESFTYTEAGAYAKIERMKHSPYFSNAIVERV